jgi:hypothetical protein
MEPQWNDIDKGKPKNSEINLTHATWSTTNPIWTDLGTNLGLHGERPVINCPSHGMVWFMVWFRGGRF